MACAKMPESTYSSSPPTGTPRAIRDTHVEGKSIAEAASGAGIGESDVKISVHRGLKALGARIKGQG